MIVSEQATHRSTWREVNLGEVADYLNGRAFKPTEWEQEGIPIIRIQNLNKPEAGYNYTTKEFKEKYRITNGDLLFAWSASLDAYIWKKGPAWLNQHIFRVDCKPYIKKHFLYYYLKKLITDFYVRAHGSGMVHITKKKFEATLIALPPLPEQRAIVTKLEALFHELDEGIASLQRAQDQLKIYRQAVLKKAFEGELTRAWREQQTDLPTAEELLAQIQAERERYYQEQLVEWEEAVRVWEAEGKAGKKPSRPKKLILSKDDDKISSHSNWINIEFSDIVDAIDPQPSHRTPPKVDGGIPYVSIADLNKDTGEIDFSKARKVGVDVLEEHRSRYQLSKGDFIIGKIGTIGKPFIIPPEQTYTLSANVVLIKPLSSVSSKYIFHLCGSPLIEKQFKEGAKATTQSAFGIKKVRTLTTLLPSLPEQHQIVQEIESRLSVCDQVEKDIIANLKRAERLRQSILQKAFAGELLTEAELAACRAEPDWEPAKRLLERIKKHKVK